MICLYSAIACPKARAAEVNCGSVLVAVGNSTLGPSPLTVAIGELSRPTLLQWFSLKWHGRKETVNSRLVVLSPAEESALRSNRPKEAISFATADRLAKGQGEYPLSLYSDLHTNDGKVFAGYLIQHSPILFLERFELQGAFAYRLRRIDKKEVNWIGSYTADAGEPVGLDGITQTMRTTDRIVAVEKIGGVETIQAAKIYANKISGSINAPSYRNASLLGLGGLGLTPGDTISVEIGWYNPLQGVFVSEAPFVILAKVTGAWYQITLKNDLIPAVKAETRASERLMGFFDGEYVGHYLQGVSERMKLIYGELHFNPDGGVVIRPRDHQESAYYNISREDALKNLFHVDRTFEGFNKAMDSLNANDHWHRRYAYSHYQRSTVHFAKDCSDDGNERSISFSQYNDGHSEISARCYGGMRFPVEGDHRRSLKIDKSLEPSFIVKFLIRSIELWQQTAWNQKLRPSFDLDFEQNTSGAQGTVIRVLVNAAQVPALEFVLGTLAQEFDLPEIRGLETNPRISAGD